jgi:hypothetical protein
MVANVTPTVNHLPTAQGMENAIQMDNASVLKDPILWRGL